MTVNISLSGVRMDRYTFIAYLQENIPSKFLGLGHDVWLLIWPRSSLRNLIEKDEYITAVCFINNEKLATGSADGRIYVINSFLSSYTLA